MEEYFGIEESVPQNRASMAGLYCYMDYLAPSKEMSTLHVNQRMVLLFRKHPEISYDADTQIPLVQTLHNPYD
jgi:hypothetical protein